MAISTDEQGGLSARLQIDQICDRFESAWREGARPRLEAYLAGADSEFRSELLRELVWIDRAYRIRMGEAPSIAEYQNRLPDDAVALAAWLRAGASRAEDPASGEMDDMPVAFGRYQVLERLGAGGFGDVYLGFDQELKRRVAIKVPRPERMLDPIDAEQFLAEAQILASLDHPNIVSVYDAGRTRDGVCFVVSKWIEGTDLARALRKARLGSCQSAEVAAKLADALQHAHSRKLIHRDLKPANILLDADGEPYLADFGLALSPEAFGRQTGLAGTYEYMSPEQARGEGHLVDGRSDIFSLGIVLYEMLTGERPFVGPSWEAVLQRIRSVDPRPPRQLHPDVPKELERICLKAMAKRASDRYTTAVDLADDLRHYLGCVAPDPRSTIRLAVPPEVASSARIVPKGLRSFDQLDADFYLELLPGARDREGLPEIIRHWKMRIDETDSDRTFRIGLVYGPSGSGKSSMVKAGLLPRLDRKVTAIYMEMSGTGDEPRLLGQLQRRFDPLRSSESLADAISRLRRPGVLPPGRKVLIVLDQFEQWLHRHGDPGEAPLVHALRQCNGQHVQCLLLARDDFWMAATRFMREVDEPIVEGRNSAAVDLFDLIHARKVLAEFGRAFGRLPNELAAMTPDQERFLDQALAELVQGGKVVPVRLALFADIVRGREWVPATLRNLGGERGITITYLEETFSAPTAPPQHRLHQRAARAVLGALLPAGQADIRGGMRSHQDLLRVSGYEDDWERFLDLLRILDTETRLITPVEPDESGGPPKPGAYRDALYYHLTHDHLVQPLREWLTLKQRETHRGRARLMLSERSARWNALGETRQLPSWWEFVYIRAWTRKREWTEQERRMMAASGRRFLLGVAVAAVLMALAAVGTQQWRAWTMAGELFASLGSFHPAADLARWRAQDGEVPEGMAIYKRYYRWLRPRLQALLANPRPGDQLYQNGLLIVYWGEGPNRSPPEVRQALYQQMLAADAPRFQLLASALAPIGPQLLPEIQATLRQADGEDAAKVQPQVFRALCFLAHLSERDPAILNEWTERRHTLVDRLVHEVVADPSSIEAWTEILKGSADELVPPLRAIAQDRAHSQGERLVATNLLVALATPPEPITPQLLASATREQVRALIQLFRKTPRQSIPLLEALLDQSHLPADQREEVIRAPAAAAAVLAALGRWDHVWHLMLRASDPRPRSYLVHRLAELEVPPDAMVARLRAYADSSQEPGLAEAIMLSLGTYSSTLLPESERKQLVPKLKEIYMNDPDAGVHSAAEWLLRHWRFQAEWEEATAALVNRGKPHDGRQWYVTRKEPYFTLVVLRPPPTITIGAQPGPDVSDYDAMVEVQIPRIYAVATKEVTIEQFQNLGFQPNTNRSYAATDTCPVAYVRWQDAARFCNALSAQELIPPDQWCFEVADDGSVRLPPDYLTRTGYRMLTEAEWEYACRGGTTTVRPDGNDLDLLQHYAWYNGSRYPEAKPVSMPVGQLKPNAFGLFDMLGNVAERCIDRILANSRSRLRSYPVDSEDCVLEVLPERDPHHRSLRGGKFSDSPYLLQSARRSSIRPESAEYNVGLRIGRTIASR